MNLADILRRWKVWVPILAAALAAAGITLVVTDDDENGTPDHVVVHVDSDPVKPGRQEHVITVPKAALEQAEASDLDDHEDSRSETPPGVTAQQIEQSRIKQEELAARDDLPNVTPLAAPEQRGCVTRLVVNFSSRRGVAPRLLVAHYTVSPNLPGWSDVDSVVALFNRPSFAASSNYVIDNEGHCAYIVRESDKAWTQAGANPYSISIEVINSGREPTLAGTAGLAKIGQVFADAAKRWKIPIQQGAVSGCVPTRAGIVQHKDLGICGGGHVDIAPFPTATVIDAVRKANAPACDAKCERTRSLRARHTAAHTQLRHRHCAPRARTRSPRCRALWATNSALHRAAAREHITL